MRYEFHPEAEVDFVETILYYESQVPGLGERFAAEVRDGIEQLLKHPKIGAIDEEGFRKWAEHPIDEHVRMLEQRFIPARAGNTLPPLMPRN